MTSLSVLRPAIWRRFENFWKSFTQRGCFAALPDDTPEEVRARRDFILEMQDSYPEAFQSELDIRFMARMYHCKF